MTSVAEIWMKETGLYAGGEKVRILSGIERLKSFLKVDQATMQPRIVFSDRCKGAISEFGAMPNPISGLTQAYAWKIDKDGQPYGEVPDDTHIHALKALWYGLVAKFGHAREQEGMGTFQVRRFGKVLVNGSLPLRDRIRAKVADPRYGAGR